MIRIIHVAGARPNFMKVAPVMEAFAGHPRVVQKLVHTGQHYDDSLSRIFFDELGIPAPDVHLEIGSGSHAVQTARIMIAFEQVCLEWRPDLVVVVGDVNSTVACALVAAKLGIPVAHVEAGLRSFDHTMPEEINRIVTDRLSDLLFTTEPSGGENLLKEGVDPERIHFVGNVMIDTLRKHLERARSLGTPERLGVTSGGYALVTLHRPSNVDQRESLAEIVGALEEIARTTPVLFPLHPRTRRKLSDFGLGEGLGEVRLLDPLGYLEFLSLMGDAALVITDSGGVQEETTVLGTPCLTVRPNTERPITIEEGTNRLVNPARAEILAAVEEVLSGLRAGGRKAIPKVPKLWDGGAAERIVDVVLEHFDASGSDGVEGKELFALDRGA